ncbi:TPA: RDD family protein [Candidatus Micrarchaeota archaeon]|nr:RDD family protein [Candidatus Micrarchaeota archaeon]
MAKKQAAKKAAGKTPKYAGFIIRAAANLVDGIVVILLALGLFLIPIIGSVLVILMMLFYEIYFTGKDGATPGKKFMKLKVIRKDGVVPVGYDTAAIRVVGEIISNVLLYLGYLLIIFDERKQGLHDKLANTYVVYSE